MSVHVESLDFKPDNPLAVKAANLLVSELGLIELHETLEQRVGRYFAEMGVENMSHYALLKESDGVVAAAVAAHELSVKDSMQTELVAIAVDRRYQRQGFGRLLLKHVAEQALVYGDEKISVWPIDKERREPYRHFGFDDEEVIMRASPYDVLNS